MSQYGEMIDSGVDLDKINTYDLFVKYFENPLLRLIKPIQADMFVVYGCKIKSLLVKDIRYILVTIPAPKLPSPFPSQLPLEGIEWKCLETRLISDDLNVPTHKYTQKNVNSVVNVVSKDDTKFVYSCQDFPSISITLFSTKNQTRQYNDKGTISLALETYQCAINL